MEQPDLLIRPLDLTVHEDLAQLNALREANDRERYGAIDPMSIGQRRAELESTEFWDQAHWVAEVETLEGGRGIVGLASLMLARRENLENADGHLEVHPAYRGRGIGTALLERALRPAIADAGRERVTVYGELPAQGDPDDPSLPPNVLARRLGLARRHLEVVRALPLPIPGARLDALAAEAREKQDGYRIIAWRDEVPEEHLTAYGTLLRQLEVDDPAEDLEHEVADYSPERIRFAEQRARARGLRKLTAVAVAPDGTFAGNTTIQYREGEAAQVGWQENTLVMPEHRGHRLGLALKVANHRTLAEQAPHLTTLITWNSHVNPWMIAINEKLGYEVAFREIAYQGRPEA